MPDPLNGTGSERPTAKGIAVAIIIGCTLLILAAEGILRLAMPHWQEFYSGWFMHRVLVPDYGMVKTGRPGFDGYFAQNNGDFRVKIQINAFGLRNAEAVTAADGRVWFVGDSMTFGWGVEQDEIYSSVAGRLAKVPVYNVASPGAGVCGYQALLARMPENFRSRAVVIGLILENDIHAYDCRKTAASVQATMGTADNPPALGSETNLKRVLTKYTALYNFFAVGLKRVAFIQGLLRRFGIISQSHSYYRALPDAEVENAVQRTATELAALQTQLSEGTPLTVLIAPARFEIRDEDAFFRKLRIRMAAALAERGISTIDPIEAFRKAGFEPTHFIHDGHWSPLGHELAGREVAYWLRNK